LKLHNLQLMLNTIRFSRQVILIVGCKLPFTLSVGFEMNPTFFHRASGTIGDLRISDTRGGAF